MIRPTSLTAALVALVLGTTSLAAAQSAEDERARTHFESGRLHFEDGAYDRAREEFMRAWELSQRPPLLINLATTEERLGMYAEAIEHLSDYVERVPDDPNRAQIERRVANLRRLAAERGASTTTTTTTETGATGDGATGRASASSGGGGGDGLILGGIVGLAVGGAGFIAQAIFGGLALSEDSRLAEGCGATQSCTAADVSDANTFALVSDVMMGVGIAGVGAGAVLLILGLTSSDADSAALLPHLDPNGGGLTARGSF